MNRGYHHIIDFYGCDPAQIEHQPFWDRVLHDAADKACMEVLCAKFHKFDPRGLTGFLLLSTSHLSWQPDCEEHSRWLLRCLGSLGA